MKLDIGSGRPRRAGYLTIDITREVNPDLVWDVENRVLPYDGGSIEEIRAWSVLEHFHDDSKVFVMTEFWRLLKDDGVLDIAVPLCHTPQAWQDPTHLSHWNRRSFWYFTKGNRFRDAFAKRVSGELPAFIVAEEGVVGGYLQTIKLKKDVR